MELELAELKVDKLLSDAQYQEALNRVKVAKEVENFRKLQDEGPETALRAGNLPLIDVFGNL